MISVLFSVFLNFSLNTQFYPSLLKYQAGVGLIDIIDKENIDVNDIYSLGKKKSWSLDFYTQRFTPAINISELDEYKGKWLFVYDRDMEKIKSNGISWDSSYVVPNYRITMLKLPFLNPETRNNELNKVYLLHLN